MILKKHTKKGKVIMTEYHLILHVNQGDSFGEFLDQANGNIANALTKWANDFRSVANICEQLSLKINNENIDVMADGHTIIFMPKNIVGQQILEELSENCIIDKFEFDEDVIDDGSFHDDTLANL